MGIAKKSGREKKREEKKSTGSTTTKLKNGKSATKQQAKKPHSTFGGVKDQTKVIAVTKTDPTKKVRVKKSAVVKKSEKKIEKTNLGGAKKGVKTTSVFPGTKLDKKSMDVNKDGEKTKTDSTKKTAERTKKGDKIKDKPKGMKTT